MGALVLVAGVVAIPYPGPGRLIVFLGLGILASEFDPAHRILRFVRVRYEAWARWLGRRQWSIPGLVGLGTCAVVVVSLWALGVVGTVAGWLHVDASWGQSPIL